MSVILIVEDDIGLQKQMRWCFEDDEVFTTDNVDEALQLAQTHQPDVITLDLGLPPDPGGTQEGMRFLQTIGSSSSDAKVIVITGREEHEHALAAIAGGAYDYYQKPIDSQTLQFVVQRAIKLRELEREVVALRSSSSSAERLVGLIANSQTMLTLCDHIERVAPTDTTVIINGETGTGKEIIAHNIHRLSQRSAGPMVAINCAAIPENLLESELFGHEKGSFTGAHSRKIGKVEAADGGTLFLDEIGDMPPTLQAKILRFLQEREFERVGATQTIPADVRVVCATHRDLNAMVANNEFREDLYYRLSEFTVNVPALRDRGNDVLLIAKHLLQLTGESTEVGFSEDAINAMQAHEWTGNVRELENRIRRALILRSGNEITAADLELSQSTAKPIVSLKDVRANAEREAIVNALAATSDNISEAARLLGTSRPTLYSLIEKLGIESPRS